MNLFILEIFNPQTSSPASSQIKIGSQTYPAIAILTNEGKQLFHNKSYYKGKRQPTSTSPITDPVRSSLPVGKPTSSSPITNSLPSSSPLVNADYRRTLFADYADGLDGDCGIPASLPINKDGNSVLGVKKRLSFSRQEGYSLLHIVESYNESYKNIRSTKEVESYAETRGEANGSLQSYGADSNRQFMGVNRNITTIPNHSKTFLALLVVKPNCLGFFNRENRHKCTRINVSIHFDPSVGRFDFNRNNWTGDAFKDEIGEDYSRHMRIEVKSSGRGTLKNNGVILGCSDRALLSSSWGGASLYILPPLMTRNSPAYLSTNSSRCSPSQISSLLWTLDLNLFLLTLDTSGPSFSSARYGFIAYIPYLLNKVKDLVSSNTLQQPPFLCNTLHSLSLEIINLEISNSARSPVATSSSPIMGRARAIKIGGKGKSFIKGMEVGLVASQEGNNVLAEALADSTGADAEAFIIPKHRDGESRPVIVNPSNIKGKQCLIVHRIRRDGDDDFVNLLFMIEGLRDFGARSIQCLISKSLKRRSRDLLEVVTRIADGIYLTEDDNYGKREGFIEIEHFDYSPARRATVIDK